MIIPLRARRDSDSAFHVTVLSNFARAYDKYLRQYCKARIPESTYPNEFYLLERADLGVGISKASGLLTKLDLPGNALIVLESRLPRDALKPSARGVGFVWPRSTLPIHGVHRITSGGLRDSTPEEVMAASLALHSEGFIPYADLKPRSLSFLPIAKGCQAACPFCFSEASASLEQRQAQPRWANIEQWVQLAQQQGAQRAVITGGGEPTLLERRDLIALVRACSSGFATVVLITNGFSLATACDPAAQLLLLREAGLSVLAISRHHPDEATNERLMNLETCCPRLLAAYRAAQDRLKGLRLRLVCVLQRGGVETVSDVADYVTWAAAAGADEVCFKELYVSTSVESRYHSSQSNDWSAQHQVPLAIVHEWAVHKECHLVGTLPWGAPIFDAAVGERSLRVAAYTEPSLFWERTNGIARSWNIMADGTCLASLEDRTSIITASHAGNAP